MTDEDISPIEVFTYDLVVTSYSHLAAEVLRKSRFEKEVKTYKGRPQDRFPKRPHQSIFSGFYEPLIHPWGEFLILDEAHNVKNTNTAAHNAVALLRENLETCVMLSGTPLDNTWRDGVAAWGPRARPYILAGDEQQLRLPFWSNLPKPILRERRHLHTGACEGNRPSSLRSPGTTANHPGRLRPCERRHV